MKEYPAILHGYCQELKRHMNMSESKSIIGVSWWANIQFFLMYGM